MRSLKPLNRAALDKAGCDNPNCGHDHTVLFLQSACHPGGGVEAAYDKRTGLLTIRCNVCERRVVEVEVAA
jgi:hypothetical protein